MTEPTGVENYDPNAFPPFAVTVDIVVFTLLDDRLQMVLIQRGGPPFEKVWALPGGFVHVDEDLETAVRRELLEETGVESGPAHLEQLGAYGTPERDPRMRVVTVAWWAIMPDLPPPEAGTDAVHADLVGVDDVLEGRVELAFDHRQIVVDAVEALREELENTTLAASFWADSFRISDLRRVYEIVWGSQLEPGNFQRKVRKIPGWLKSTGKHSASVEGGRPAELFRTAEDRILRLEAPLRRERDTDERNR
jgi:8-oxo-dGTP diphosphatase